jgi:hypothetical protein
MRKTVSLKWMIDYEAKLRDGVQKRFGFSHGTRDEKTPSDESTHDQLTHVPS